MNIDAPSAAIQELERQLSLNEDVIRYLTLRVDEHEVVPRRCCASAKRATATIARRGPRGDRPDRPRRPRDDAQAGAF